MHRYAPRDGAVKGPEDDLMGRGVARWARAAIVLLLLVGSAAAPAAAASADSPAVQAATASGTPVIPPPKPTSKPFTCTPNKQTKRCRKTARRCRTISGVRTCFVKTVTCRRIGRYKRCVLTTSTCRTSRTIRTKSGKFKTTCRRTGRRITITRLSASLVSGPIPGFSLQPSGQSGAPGATRLVSTTTAAAPPVAGAAPAPTVPPGAAIGVLVLVLALAGLTMTRRRPRSRR